MKRLPRRYFLVPTGSVNEIIAEAFPHAQVQRDLPAVKNSRMFTITASWELTAQELVQLKQFCLEKGIKFDVKIWVKCGDNPIHLAAEADWNPEVEKRKKKQKVVRRSIRTFVTAGKFPHQIPQLPG